MVLKHKNKFFGREEGEGHSKQRKSIQEKAWRLKEAKTVQESVQNFM